MTDAEPTLGRIKGHLCYDPRPTANGINGIELSGHSPNRHFNAFAHLDDKSAIRTASV